VSLASWRLAYGGIVLGFLAMVGSYYSPETGFTIFLTLPASNHSRELPAVQAVPHAHNEHDGGYDGQFYSQMAMDPLLRDPAIDRALDTPGYRSHRILFSWTAWAMGFGKPAWILQAYAVQNVLAWLILAGTLLIWCPPRDGRTFLLWGGTLFTHGLLSSVRNAVPDGPSVMLITLAVLAADRGRPWLSALVTAVAGLARETNLLAGVAVIRAAWRSHETVVAWRVAKLAMALSLCVVPLALWLDYLRSIYGSEVLAGSHHITWPLSGLWWKLQVTIGAFTGSGLTSTTVASAASLLGFLAQSVALVWCTRECRRSGTGSTSWLLVAWAFLVLGLVAHRVVWDGTPGAITRVTLPLTVGVNMLMAAHGRSPWWLIIGANLGVISGVMAFGLGWI
jgi:hypothetical protein